MKKTILLFITIVMLMSALTSCQKTNSESIQTTFDNTETQELIKKNDEVEVYNEFIAYSTDPQGGTLGESSNNLAYSELYYSEWKENDVPDKVVNINEKDVIFKYYFSLKNTAYDCAQEVFIDAKNGLAYYIFFKYGTNEIMKFHSDIDSPPIKSSEKELVSENDFIEYAKEIAKDYIDPDEYAFSIDYIAEEESKSSGVGMWTGMGNRYVFKRKLLGFDTNDYLMLYIRENGELRRIERSGIGRFDKFLDIEVDFEKLNQAIKNIEKGNDLRKELRVSSDGELCLLVGLYDVIPIAKIIDGSIIQETDEWNLTEEAEATSIVTHDVNTDSFDDVEEITLD